MAAKKPKYHHGDLRTALIQAADAIIAEGGIETFSLRAAAQRAGVSPAAPAHHFGSARGLLTEVALLAYGRAEKYLAEAGHSDDPVMDMRALSRSFVAFAVENPGHFRLMFRHDLVDRSDPRFSEASSKPGRRLGLAILAYHGKKNADPSNFDNAADMLCGLSTMHGLAHLVLEGKAAHFFEDGTSENFVRDVLPRVIERLYPAKDPASTPPPSAKAEHADAAEAKRRYS